MRNHLVSPVLHDRAAVVTLDPVAATSAVGRTLKLRGTVRGGAVEIKIQRSYTTGGWTTVAK